MRCDLRAYFGKMRNEALPTGQQSRCLSCESFRDIHEVPEHLNTDQIKILKRYHDYATSRVDQLMFFADKETYQCLGLLILCVVFRPELRRVHLTLSDPGTLVKHLVVEYGGSTCRGSGYWTRPDRLLFRMEPVETHPWKSETQDLFALPTFALTNVKDFLVTEEDWANRDTVKGFGSDDGSIKLGSLLLRLGSADNETDEVVLEGEGGFRGVGLHSAEAAFYLPTNSVSSFAS